MEMRKKRKNENVESFSAWKEKNKSYIYEFQVFLDKAENIENESLRKDIIMQMLKCDKTITKIAQEKINEYSIKKINK